LVKATVESALEVVDYRLAMISRLYAGKGICMRATLNSLEASFCSLCPLSVTNYSCEDFKKDLRALQRKVWTQRNELLRLWSAKKEKR